MRAHRRLQHPFTLIELLVVVSIIAILAAMLLPALRTARERAKRALCANTVRQWTGTLTMYADDSSGWFPGIPGIFGKPTPGPGGGYSTMPHYVSYQMRDLLVGSHNLTRDQFYCPTNTDWNELQKLRWTVPDATYTNSFVIGYVCVTGQSGFPSRPADQPSYQVLVADLNRRYLSDWQGGVNHPSGVYSPDGANHGFIDGSVRWMLPSAFAGSPLIVFGGPTEFFLSGNP